MGDLDNALQLRRVGPGLWAAYADPNYESANGMFGGWTTAVALRAVCDEAQSDASACSLTIDFVSKIEPGSEVVIATRCVGEGRSVSFWQSELKVADTTMAVASVVLTKRRETDGHVGLTMPDAPNPSTLELIFPAPAASGERLGVRPVVGTPAHLEDCTYTAGWVRDLSGRTVDRLQLALLSDHRAPRSFLWSDGPRPSTTLTLSVYFHATDEELASVGDDEILSEAFGTRGAQSTSEEHLRLWSRSGALLATSVQMDWYR